MLNDRSRRIADLFIEGIEAYFGQDKTGKPVVVWVNKVNSFESEDARRDGAVERGRRIAELSKPDNPEFVGLQAQLNSWSLDRLAEQRVNQQSDTLSLAALDDVEAEHRELLDRVRRGPELLDDAGVDADDPKRQQLLEDQQTYFRILRETQAEKYAEALDVAKETMRADLVEEYIEAWREREAMDGFLGERRITELFFAMRDCQATIAGHDSQGKPLFDHEHCDHNRRLLSTRREVRELGDDMLDKIIDLFDNLGVSARDSGNSDAPASSSESSGQQSAPEVSTPSTPEETSPAAPTT